MGDISMRSFGVLFDAEKVGAEVASPVLSSLSEFGELTMKRAYADWGAADAQPWARELARHAIAPMQQTEFSAGRHADRSALVVHALDLHHAGVLDGFAIVCGDDSYARLASKLHEGGAFVVGVGGPGVSSVFKSACTRYLDLEEIHTYASANRVARAAAAMGLRTA